FVFIILVGRDKDFTIEPPSSFEVGVSGEKNGDRRTPIAAAPPNFLVVAVDVLREAGVDDGGDLRLIDAETKRRSRDNKVEFVLLPRTDRFGPFRRRRFPSHRGHPSEPVLAESREPIGGGQDLAHVKKKR